MSNPVIPPPQPPRGLSCPACGCGEFFTDHTRKAMRMIIRYRHCRHCGKRMTTCERVIVKP